MTLVRNIPETIEPAWFLIVTNTFARALPFSQNHRDSDSVCIRAETYCCGEDMQKLDHAYVCTLCSRIVLTVVSVNKKKLDFIEELKTKVSLSKKESK